MRSSALHWGIALFALAAGVALLLMHRPWEPGFEVRFDGRGSSGIALVFVALGFFAVGREAFLTWKGKD